MRRLYLRSRERAKALKDQKYTCQECGAKQSKAKGKEVAVEVHHQRGVDWEGLIEDIRHRLLSGKLIVLCKACHKKRHEG